MILCCCCISFINSTGICGDKSLFILNSISVLFTLVPLCSIHWSYFRIASLITYIFLALFCIACLIINIIIHIWRNKDLLKDKYKNHANILINIATAIVILLLSDCIATESLCSIDISKVNYPCNNNISEEVSGIDCSRVDDPENYNSNLIKDYEVYLIYLGLTLVELANLIALCNWNIIQNKIIRGVHLPSNSINQSNLQATRIDMHGNAYLRPKKTIAYIAERKQQQQQINQQPDSSYRQNINFADVKEDQNKTPNIEEENKNNQPIIFDVKAMPKLEENINISNIQANA